MLNWKTVAYFVTMLLFLAGCSKPSANSEQHANESGRVSAGFINRVWRVSKSSDVASGTLYVFLSEGTLVIASPNGKPALGRWKDESGELTMVEDGVSYKVDVLNLSKDEFKIRSNNPGQPVEITLVPAEGQSRPK